MKNTNSIESNIKQKEQKGRLFNDWINKNLNNKSTCDFKAKVQTSSPTLKVARKVLNLHISFNEISKANDAKANDAMTSSESNHQAPIAVIPEGVYFLNYS
jgi:hypothetical protein